MGMAEVKALISGNTVHFENLSNGQILRAYPRIVDGTPGF